MSTADKPLGSPLDLFQDLESVQVSSEDPVIESSSRREFFQPSVVVLPAVMNPPTGKGISKEMLETLKAGVIQSLAVAPSPSVLDPLYAKFPNFHEVLDKLSRHLHLAARVSGPVPLRLPPLLLTGSPGVGKSKFAWNLAKALRLPVRELDFATMTAGFVLAGTSSQWSDSKTGVVFDQLVRGESANPLFIGDELDKAPSSENGRYSPFGPLYTLLEQESAKRFIDEHIECALDASWISWVFMANDTRTIPDAILSRLTVIRIPDPTDAQLLAIAQSIYSDIIESEPWGTTFPDTLEEVVLQSLVAIKTPREIRNALMDAFGQAALNKAPHLMRCHFQQMAPKKGSIGFIQSTYRAVLS
jgi:ATP-dependent Lon protease